MIKTKLYFSALKDETYTVDLPYYISKYDKDPLEEGNISAIALTSPLIEVLDFNVIKGDVFEDKQIKSLSLKLKFKDVGQSEVKTLKLHNIDGTSKDYPLDGFYLSVFDFDLYDDLDMGEPFPIVTSGQTYMYHFKNISEDNIVVKSLVFNEMSIAIDKTLSEGKALKEELLASVIAGEETALYILRPVVVYMKNGEKRQYLPFAQNLGFMRINTDLMP